MQILFLAPKYDYGIKARGLSAEYYFFAEPLLRLGHDILYFDYPTLTEKYGFHRMSRRLAEVIRTDKPRLTFCVLTGDQVERKVMRQITDSGLTTTTNWYCDDHFNFESFSKRWTPCFTWAITTALCNMPRYEKLGMKNVIKSQWAANPFVYRKLDLPLKYDVTFVGLRHGNRPKFVAALQAAGVKVDCWGHGWKNGRLSQDEMVAVFNQSRINLNFTNGAMPPSPLYQWRQRMKHSAFGRMENSPLGLAVKRQLKRFRPAPVTAPGAVAIENEDSKIELPADLSTLVPDGMRQIKGRNFDVPGCGGFLMTGNAENLSDYLADGREQAIFETGKDLVERVRYYLDHEEERATIANAGYARTMAEHTYLHRMRDIFARAGLPAVDVEGALAGRLGRGQLTDAD